MDNLIQNILIAALPIVLAITLHEAAHGYVARHFGDPTAWKLGRITLNPLKHIDPLGTVVIPLMLYLLTKGAFVFGYAKPVPVNPAFLRNPKRDMVWVAAAGPATNLVMALFWAILLKLVLLMPEMYFSVPLKLMSKSGLIVNAVMVVLNLLPLPPLDGGRIVTGLLPDPLAWRFAQLERWGFFILLALMFTRILDAIMHPLVGLLVTVIVELVDIIL